MLPTDIINLSFLVVDDYPTIRLLIERELRLLGVDKITFADSGSKALSILQERLQSQNPIGFLITDLIMEDGSGLELTRKIRLDEKLKNLPILMVTSKADIHHVLEAVRAGVNSYIVKPWSSEDFAPKIIESYGRIKSSKG